MHQVDFNHPMTRRELNAEYSGKRDPSLDSFSKFIFDQRVIPLEGGKHSFALLKPLVLHINPDTMRFKVQDWEIELDCASLGDLPREVARRFLRLLGEAESESLGEADQAALLHISDYIDFQQFSMDRSAPRYMEGILYSKTNVMIVQWHDGSRETLMHQVGQALTEVNLGERFSAFVKLGKNDQTESIERVSLLPPIRENEDWESWPQKSS